jgi:hypothetical protein
LIKQHLAAIAIVFYFVNPVFPLWGLIDRRCDLRLDEAELAIHARHAMHLGKASENASHLVATTASGQG